jgi:hypothetical protein
MSVSPKKEALAAVFSILNADTELKTGTATSPTTGAARTLVIYNQPVPTAAVPYVRISLTDSRNIVDETYDLTTQPTAKNINLLVDVFDEYEPSCYAISDRLEALLQHAAINTTHFNGSSWLTGTTYFTENETDPDRVYRRASLRVRINLQPN